MKSPSFVAKLLMLILLSVLIGCELIGEKSPKFPRIVRTVDGKRINIRQLTREKTVVIISMKAPDCPVCQSQLIRINEHMEEFSKCNISFLVLTPGPVESIYDAGVITEFPYPFIEDKNLVVSKSLGIKMNDEEIFPTIFVISDDLSVKWIKLGRNAFQFGDKELLEKLDCTNWL